MANFDPNMSQEQLENLQLKAEELLYKNEKDKLFVVIEYLEIEIDASLGKGKIIREIRKKLDHVVEKQENTNEEKVSILNTVISHLDESVVPPLEKTQSEKEIIELEKAYSELQNKFEQEKKEILSKLGEKKKLAGESNANATSADVIQIAENENTLTVSESKITPLLRREFKISGQIGEPGQTDKLTFVSLTHQVESGLKRGYKEQEIVDAVVRVISPHSSLRSYVETLRDLKLSKLRKILRVHYREKNASELYHELATIFQDVKESPQQFLLRALEIRNKTLFASQEADCELKYETSLIQKTFLKSFETGLREDILVTNLRPNLRSADLTDEFLMKTVNEIASQQAERKTKLGQKNAKICATVTSEPKQSELAGNDLILAAIKEIKSDLSNLTSRVDSELKSHSKSQSQRKGKLGRGWGCEACKEKGRASSCKHCFICGGSNHFARECTTNNHQGNDKRLVPQDRA